jgi:hypothetical protein
MENTEDKGRWADVADEGIVPDELGEDTEGEGPEGRVTGSAEPATEAGVDLGAGDEADATSDGGVELPEGAEPDLKDAMGAHQRPDAGTGG